MIQKYIIAAILLVLGFFALYSGYQPYGFYGGIILLAISVYLVRGASKELMQKSLAKAAEKRARKSNL